MFPRQRRFTSRLATSVGGRHLAARRGNPQNPAQGREHNEKIES
jgi:hypothetical protein